MPTTVYGHLRYLVPSDDARRADYLVDLVSYEGQGRCSCADWNTRCWPNIRDDKKARKQCKHIRRARLHLEQFLWKNGFDLSADEIIQEWIRRYGSNNQHDEE